MVVSGDKIYPAQTVSSVRVIESKDVAKAVNKIAGNRRWIWHWDFNGKIHKGWERCWVFRGAFRFGEYAGRASSPRIVFIERLQ